MGGAAVPAAIRLRRLRRPHLGQHRLPSCATNAVVLAEIVQVAINLGLLFIGRGAFWPLIALTVAQGLAQGSGNLMLRAIVCDIADERRLKTGREHSGLLFSIFNVTSNAAAAAAVGVAYPLLAWLGFHPGQPSSPAALAGLGLLFALGPALGHTLSALLIWRFPLDEAAHAKVRRELDAIPTVSTAGETTWESWKRSPAWTSSPSADASAPR